MVSSGLLRRVALVRTQKTPFLIVTAVKTSNLTSYGMYKLKKIIIWYIILDAIFKFISDVDYKL
jgi:hypothetical protein